MGAWKKQLKRVAKLPESPAVVRGEGAPWRSWPFLARWPTGAQAMGVGPQAARASESFSCLSKMRMTPRRVPSARSRTAARRRTKDGRGPQSGIRQPACRTHNGLTGRAAGGGACLPGNHPRANARCQPRVSVERRLLDALNRCHRRPPVAGRGASETGVPRPLRLGGRG